MTDRELLELAAKAAGVELQPMEFKNVSNVGDDRFIGYMVSADRWPRGWFNPLTDDGDALRLAVTLGMRLTMPKHKGFGTSVEHQCWAAAGCTAFDDDVFKQTRRAIVRAAAEVGRGME